MYTQVKMAFVAGIVMVGFAVAANASTVFSDNFESGNLNNWTVGGRQEGTNVANVVSYNGSLSAHLYHEGFTEIALFRHFPYDPNYALQFDMAVNATSESPPGDTYYGRSGVYVHFRDTSNQALGYAYYGAATTNFIFDRAAGDPTTYFVRVSPNEMDHYVLKLSDLLSQINIDTAKIDNIDMEFETYSSTWPYPTVTAELWTDNVKYRTVPEPSSFALLALGGLAALQRKMSGAKIRGA